MQYRLHSTTDGMETAALDTSTLLENSTVSEAKGVLLSLMSNDNRNLPYPPLKRDWPVGGREGGGDIFISPRKLVSLLL